MTDIVTSYKTKNNIRKRNNLQCINCILKILYYDYNRKNSIFKVLQKRKC